MGIFLLSVLICGRNDEVLREDYRAREIWGWRCAGDP